jgi:hypothetical protein
MHWNHWSSIAIASARRGMNCAVAEISARQQWL